MLDPRRAAEQFAFLVLGPVLDRAMFNGRDEPLDADALSRAAEDGVRTFLAAYGQPTPSEVPAVRH